MFDGHFENYTQFSDPTIISTQSYIPHSANFLEKQQHISIPTFLPTESLIISQFSHGFSLFSPRRGAPQGPVALHLGAAPESHGGEHFDRCCGALMWLDGSGSTPLCNYITMTMNKNMSMNIIEYTYIYTYINIFICMCIYIYTYRLKLFILHSYDNPPKIICTYAFVDMTNRITISIHHSPY